MRRMFMWALGLIAALLVIVLLGVGGLLGARAIQQTRDARAIAITTPDRVDWGGFVTIGGVPEWVRIRGWHRGNPMLLIVHGGPTDSQSPLSVLYAPLERDFTVVQWDQRGAGRSYGRGSRLTPDTPYQRLVDDGLEVTAYLLHRFDRPRLILVGHSAGSFLAVHMIKQQPGLFYAYVGTGQIASQAAAHAEIYRKIMDAARRSKDLATIKQLEQSPPPWRTLRDWLPVDAAVRDRYADASDRAFWGWFKRPSEPAYVLTSPEINLHQLSDWDKGTRSTIFETPYPPVVDADVRPLGNDFKVPIFVIQGRNDWVTPADLAHAWLNGINAPYKEFIPIDGGHWGAMTHMAAFRDALVSRVRPFAVPQPAPTDDAHG